MFLVFKDINKWKWFDFDYILEQAETFKHIGFNKPLVADELPLDIISEGMNFSAKTLSHESHLFLNKENLFGNYRSYNVSEKGNGEIFTCHSFSISVIQ